MDLKSLLMPDNQSEVVKRPNPFANRKKFKTNEGTVLDKPTSGKDELPYHNT